MMVPGVVLTPAAPLWLIVAGALVAGSVLPSVPGVVVCPDVTTPVVAGVPVPAVPVVPGTLAA